MAFDTKLNLTDNKFEQFSGETLNLSGNTHIHGGFIINSGATFTILLNHGVDKVWTSDSGGTGTWQQPLTGGITGGTNGLRVSGKNIGLGGTLTGRTAIDLNTMTLVITGTSSNTLPYGLQLSPNVVNLGDNATGNIYLNLDNSTKAIGFFSQTSDGLLRSGGNICTGEISFSTVDTRYSECHTGYINIQTGNINFYSDDALGHTKNLQFDIGGLHYLYSPALTFSDYSLITKLYLDTRISGGTALCATTAGNALKLNNQLPAYYLNTGSTAICATTAGNALALCGCIPSCFLGATACAADSAKLGNHLPSYYLSTGSTAACAADSAKLGGILPAGYMLTGATYTLTSPAVCTVGGVTAGRVLTGKTAFQLIEEILVPEICGTLTTPSTSTALVPSGTFEIGCTISVLCVTGTFGRGSISPQGCSTSAFRSGAANCYTFAGCQVVGSYACTTSPITKCATAYVICSTQTWTISTSYDIGVQPVGSKGTNFSSPLIAGTSNVAGATITGIYPYYWGKLTSGSRPAVTNSLVTGGTKVLAVSTGTLAINFGSSSSEWTWFAIPQATTSKTCWYVTALDNGKVNNSPSDKYPDECQICVSSGQLCWSNVCYKIYMSGTVGAISATLCFS